ncbi:MAG: hypothetical protein V4443_03340 [Pseudomonadota bacterium]
MNRTNTQTITIFASLAVLMAATRYNHFGSSVTLPDASLAVFLLAGFFLARSRAALPAFVLLLLEAGAVDYYATEFQGVSSWCFSPAYWFLIPTYASLWLGGRWFAARQRKSWASLALFSGVVWLATTVAFVISNVSFYMFSGRYDVLSLTEYTAHIMQYYPSYMGSSLMYIAPAVVIYLLVPGLQKRAFA